MSNTERTNNPAQGIVRSFANDLAKLRELHGNPSFERMHSAIRHNARAAGSKNTFHRMISNPDRIYETEFVRGFVLALGLDDSEADAWEQRRVQALREYQRLRDNTEVPSAAVPPAEVPAAAVSHAAAVSPATAPPMLSSAHDRTPAQMRLSRRRLVEIATAVLVIIAASVTTFLVVGRPSTYHGNAGAGSSRLSFGGATQPRDGADPKDSGCSLDPSVLTLDSAEVDYDGRAVGLDELRYSPRCGVAWARFSPFSAARISAGAIIHVDAFRPGARPFEESFQAPYVDVPVFGNVMRSTVDCVYAAVTIEVAGKESPGSHTWCFRGKTPQESAPISGR